MNTQQINLHNSGSNMDKKLIDDKKPSSIDSYFNQKEDSSGIHQRILSSQEPLNSTFPTLENAKSLHRVQAESQLEELSPSFGMFYKTVMLLSALVSAGRSLFIVLSGSKLEPEGQLEFGTTCWAIWQFASAYQGFTKKDLKEVENAYSMMKVTFLFIGLFFGVKHYHQVMDGNQGKGSIPDYGFLISGVLVMGLHLFLYFLPTRKVRNLLKLALQEEEEKRKMEAQDPGSLKKLDSALFLIYKYGLLVLFCVGVQDFLSNILEDFSDSSMMSGSNFFLPFMERYGLNLLSNLFSFLAFEGIRKRDLKKISISAMVMKIFLVAHLLLEFHNGIAWDNEGHLMWKHKKSFGEFLQGKINFTISLFGLIYLGVFKAQEILKAHQKSPRYSL